METVLRTRKARSANCTCLALLVGIFVLASGIQAPPASAVTRLVLPPKALVGYKAAGLSRSDARADLSEGLSGKLRAAVRGAEVQASGASGRGRKVRSEAFVFSSSSRARQVLAGWRSAHHAKHAKLDSGGVVAVSRQGRTSIASVIWRHDRKLGLLVLRAKSSAGEVRTAALALARAADSALRAPVPTTAWEKVLDQIRPDGSVSEKTAMQAVALAYGPIPGVKPPGGPRQRITSATMIAGWALQYRSRLPSKQRRAVDRVLGLDSSTGPAHAASFGDPNFHQDPQLQARAQGWVRTFEQLLGHKLGLPLVVGETTTELPKTPIGGDAYADAAAINRLGGNLISNSCRIRVGFFTRGDSPPSYLDHALAHEVFHCFQFDIAPTAWRSAGAWVLEGTAEWAALSVDPQSQYDSHLRSYINSSGQPLFTRAYNAVGFWAHAHDVTGNLWARLPQVFNAGGGAAAYYAAGAGPTFLTSWGSSVFRSIAGDLNWGMASPPISKPSLRQLRPASMTEVKDSQVVYANPWTTAQYEIKQNTDKPIVHAAIAGPARLSDMFNYTTLKDGWYCMDPGACESPPGKVCMVPNTEPLEPDALLGLSAGDQTTAGGVTFYSPEDFCRDDKKTGKPKHGTKEVTVRAGQRFSVTVVDADRLQYQQNCEFSHVRFAWQGFTIPSRSVTIDVRTEPHQNPAGVGPQVDSILTASAKDLVLPSEHHPYDVHPWLVYDVSCESVSGTRADRNRETPLDLTLHVK